MEVIKIQTQQFLASSLPKGEYDGEGVGAPEQDWIEW